MYRFSSVASPVRPERPLKGGLAGGAIVRVRDTGEVHRQQLVLAVPEHLRELVVDPEKPPLAGSVCVWPTAASANDVPELLLRLAHRRRRSWAASRGKCVVEQDPAQQHHDRDVPWAWAW